MNNSSSSATLLGEPTGSWRQLAGVAGTLVVGFATFGLFAVQGILLARILGPEGRGEFAAIVAFPQMLLYLGLLGAAEIFARRAAQLPEGCSDTPLRLLAIRYGLATGLVFGLVCCLLAMVAMPQEKRYLAPMAMLGSPFTESIVTVTNSSSSIVRSSMIDTSISAVV